MQTCSYSKAEQRVQDLRIAVHEDAARFGWLDKSKQHKLPTVLNSAARSFNALAPSSALGFPFAAPNNSAKQSQPGEVPRVALWKAKLSQVKDVEALQRLADARKAKRGSGRANRTSPTLLGRMGVSDTEGVEARPRPWAVSKSATKKGTKGCGDRGGDCDGCHNADASTDRKTMGTPTDAKAGLIAPAAVVPGADKSSRPLRRPRPVVSRQLGGNPVFGSGDQRRSFSRPMKTAQSPPKLRVEELMSSQEREVTSVKDEEPSIMSDMIRSRAIKSMDTSNTGARFRRKTSSSAAQEVTQRSTAASAAILQRKQPSTCQSLPHAANESPSKPEPEPAVDAVSESDEKAPELQATLKRSSDPKAIATSMTTMEPVSKPDATPEPSAEMEPATASTVEFASEPEAKSEPEPEPVTETTVGRQPQHPSATLGAESGHDRWEDFDTFESSDNDNEDANKQVTRNGRPALSNPSQQTPTGLKNEEQAKREQLEAGWTHVYKYPQTVQAAAADQSTASLPAPDPMQGYTAARRRLQQWDGAGSRSRQQQRRRPLSASGGSAGLLRLTRRSKSYEAFLGTGMRSISPEARAYSRSSTTLTTPSSSFGTNSFMRLDRKESPPRQSTRLAIYT